MAAIREKGGKAMKLLRMPVLSGFDVEDLLILAAFVVAVVADRLF